MFDRDLYQINTMKTTLPLSHDLKANCSIFIIALILIISSVVNAQNKNLNPTNTVLGVDIFSSGNAHGSFTSPYIQFSKKRNSIAFGPLLQNCSMQIRGARMVYAKTLTGQPASNGGYYGGYKDLFQMSFFSYAQYTDGLPLAHSVIADERRIVRTQEIDFDNLLFKTAETGAGFEFKINFTNHLTWKNYVAAAVFYHFNYVKGLDHEKIAPVLTLGTGVAFDF